MNKSLLCLIAAPILLAGGAASAIVRTGDDSQVSRVVSFADLDLDTAEGRERLTTRVQMAARQVCGVRSARGLKEWQLADRCQKQAVAGAQPRLAALFGGAATALAERDDAVVVSAR